MGVALDRTTSAARPTSELRVEVAGFDEASGYGDRWNDLAERLGTTPQASYSWLKVWHDHYARGRRCVVVAGWRGDELVGVIPLLEDRRRLCLGFVRIARLMGGDSTIADVDAVTSPEDADMLWERAIETVFDDWRCHALVASPLDFTSIAPDALRRCANASALRLAWEKVVGQSTVVSLEESLDGLRRRFSKRARRNYRRGHRYLLNDLGGETAILTARDECVTAFEGLEQMHQTEWRARGARGHFGDWPGAASFHRDLIGALADRGWACMVRVCASGSVIAFASSVVTAGRAIGLIKARDLDARWDRVSPGQESLVAFLLHCIDRGCKFADLGHGEYEYKRHVGGEQQPLRSVCIARRGSFTAARLVFAKVASVMIDKIYYRAWYCRIARRFGLDKHPLRSFWIHSRL